MTGKQARDICAMAKMYGIEANHYIPFGKNAVDLCLRNSDGKVVERINIVYGYKSALRLLNELVRIKAFIDGGSI